MSTNELLSLRERILSDIVPLVLESSSSGADRFSLLMRIIQAGNAGGDVYRQAYQCAKEIENKDDQLDALLSLLEEVDFDVNRGDEPVDIDRDVTLEAQHNIQDNEGDSSANEGDNGGNS